MHRVVTLLVCLSHVMVFAVGEQSAVTLFGPFGVEPPTFCENNIRILDYTKADARALSAPIVAIARLGSGERSSRWNRRRLHNVETYLAKSEGRPGLQVTSKEGPRRRGYGVVELYIGGRLWVTLSAARNKDLKITYACDSDDTNFYPWKERYDSEQRRRQARLTLFNRTQLAVAPEPAQLRLIASVRSVARAR